MGRTEILTDNAVFYTEDENAKLVARISGLPPNVHELRRIAKLSRGDTFVYPLGPVESALYNLDSLWLKDQNYRGMKQLLFADNGFGEWVPMLRIWLVEGLLNSGAIKKEAITNESLEEKLALAGGKDFFPEERHALSQAAMQFFEGASLSEEKMPSDAQARQWLRGEVVCPRWPFMDALYLLNPEFLRWQDNKDSIRLYKTIRSAVRRFLERPHDEQQDYIARIRGDYEPSDVRYWMLRTHEAMSSLKGTAFGYAMAHGVSRNGGRKFSQMPEFSDLPVFEINGQFRDSGSIEQKLAARVKSACELWKDYLVLDGSLMNGARLYATDLASRFRIPYEAVNRALESVKIAMVSKALVEVSLPDDLGARIGDLDRREALRDNRYEAFSKRIQRDITEGSLDSYLGVPLGTAQKTVDYINAIQARIPEVMFRAWGYDHLHDSLEREGAGGRLLQRIRGYRKQARVQSLKRHGETPPMNRVGISEFERDEVLRRLSDYGLLCYERVDFLARVTSGNLSGMKVIYQPKGNEIRARVQS